MLDSGCATGLYAIELAGLVKRIDGFDTSGKMIDAARKNAGLRNIENVYFVQTDIFDERYEASTYDVILAINILHLVEDSRSTIDRIAQLLKPGGIFISSTPCLGACKTFLSFLSTCSVYLLSKISLLPYMKFYTVEKLIDLIKVRKFQMAEVEILTKSPATECYIVARKKY